MEAALIAALPSLLSAVGGGLSGVFGRDRGQATPDQQRKQQLLDQLMASIGGDGPFSHLFNLDENAFQKSFVEPAKARFANQTAPQIQQSFISSGQQRGTGLDDTLTRAGVDMDQLLNQQFAGQQQSAMDRQLQAIGLVAGGNSGAPGPDVGVGQSFLQGVGGSFGSTGFFDNLFGPTRNTQTNQNQAGAFGGSAPLTGPSAAGSRRPQRQNFRNN